MNPTRKMTMNGRRILAYLAICLFFISGNGTNLTFTNELAKPRGFYERMLEKFCRENYDELFADFWGTREYVAGSLRVDSMRIAGQREVNIFGMHESKGRLGYPVYPRKFKANIYESKKAPNEYIITFERESKTLVSGSYMESRTKTFHYEE